MHRSTAAGRATWAITGPGPRTFPIAVDHAATARVCGVQSGRAAILTGDRSKAARRPRGSSSAIDGRIRAVIENAAPGRRWPIRNQAYARPAEVEADAFTDGHDSVRCMLCYRHADQAEVVEVEMQPRQRSLASGFEVTRSADTVTPSSRGLIATSPGAGSSSGVTIQPTSCWRSRCGPPDRRGTARRGRRPCQAQAAARRLGSRAMRKTAGHWHSTRSLTEWRCASRTDDSRPVSSVSSK